MTVAVEVKLLDLMVSQSFLMIDHSNLGFRGIQYTELERCRVGRFLSTSEGDELVRVVGYTRYAQFVPVRWSY